MKSLMKKGLVAVIFLASMLMFTGCVEELIPCESVGDCMAEQVCSVEGICVPVEQLPTRYTNPAPRTSPSPRTSPTPRTTPTQRRRPPVATRPPIDNTPPQQPTQTRATVVCPKEVRLAFWCDGKLYFTQKGFTGYFPQCPDGSPAVVVCERYQGHAICSLVDEPRCHFTNATPYVEQEQCKKPEWDDCPVVPQCREPDGSLKPGAEKVICWRRNSIE